MLALISTVFSSLSSDRYIFSANSNYVYTLRSCQNIYGALIHCENLWTILKIIEMMIDDVHCTNIVKSIYYVEMVTPTTQI